MLPQFTTGDGAGRVRRGLVGGRDSLTDLRDAVADRADALATRTDALANRIADRLDATRRRIDDVRIREHLRRTERDLRAAEYDHLSAAQRRRRERQLDRLREYRRAGDFPRNERTGERSPVFVGSEGTHCALGHLLAEDGRDDLVEEVMDADPLVYVEDLGDGALRDGALDRELLAWVESKGLTHEEAARIQPGYSHAVRFATTCGPVPCWLAGAFASLVGLGVLAASEYVGYRLVGDLFPDNALKRRGALGYVTLMNVFLGALVAALTYALFP